MGMLVIYPMPLPTQMRGKLCHLEAAYLMALPRDARQVFDLPGSLILNFGGL